MPNKTFGKQWLDRSYQDLTAAELLFEHHHSSDTIAILAQQALEKMLKSILAYHNEKMIKSHDLLEILANLE